MGNGEWGIEETRFFANGRNPVFCQPGFWGPKKPGFFPTVETRFFPNRVSGAGFLMVQILGRVRFLFLREILTLIERFR
jgi:hypothetical protein